MILRRRLTFHKRAHAKRIFENIPPLMKKKEYDEVLEYLTEKGEKVYKSDTLHKMMNQVVSPVFFAHILFTYRSGKTALVTGTEKVNISSDYCYVPKFSSDKTELTDFGAIACYKDKEEFYNLMKEAGNTAKSGSSTVFYYRDFSVQEEREKLAEDIFGYSDVRYSYEEMERLLSRAGWRIYEHLDSVQAERQFFWRFNCANIRKQIKAHSNVCFVLAVKK